MNEENKVLCDGCRIYTDSFFITKYKDGKNYCSDCNIKKQLAENERKKVAKESELDKMIKAALNTPPLKLKDLKEKLKKEKEEKQDSRNKKHSK